MFTAWRSMRYWPWLTITGQFYPGFWQETTHVAVLHMQEQYSQSRHLYMWLSTATDYFHDQRPWKYLVLLMFSGNWSCRPTHQLSKDTDMIICYIQVQTCPLVNIILLIVIWLIKSFINKIGCLFIYLLYI